MSWEQDKLSPIEQLVVAIRTEFTRCYRNNLGTPGRSELEAMIEPILLEVQLEEQSVHGLGPNSQRVRDLMEQVELSRKKVRIDRAW